MHRSGGPLRISRPLSGQGVDKLEQLSQRLLLLWGSRIPEEVEVTFSAPENGANLNATIFQKDSVIKEVGQSSNRPEPAVTSKKEKVILPVLQDEEIFQR